MDNHLNRDEVIKAINGHEAYSHRYSKTTKQSMIYVATPFFDTNKTIIGFIRTSSYISDVDSFLASLYKKIGAITVISLILALLISFFISKKLTIRIARIIKHANRIENKDFSHLIEPVMDDELDDLVIALNKISRQFDHSFNAIKFEKLSFETTISVMKEGVVVYNLDGELITSNKAFISITDDDILKENTIYQLFHKIVASKSHKKCDFSINEKYYTVSGVYFSVDAEERVVIVFNDITERKMIEKVKTDFVANVAHELKTPLTSIYGFSETLEEEVSEEHKFFASIIKRNTKRVINIVKDLISLASLENIENKKNKINIETINLKEFTDSIAEIFIKKTETKGISLSFNCKDDQMIKGDPFLLEHIFINLVSNAIKYNRENGSISIDVEDFDDRVILNFRDSGIGISQENLSRIFERFFVTDRSRSTSTEGTGLGLSIVKHIVQLHGGKIDVESVIGEGSNFAITLFK